MTTTFETRLPAKVADVNKKYKSMQRCIMQLMAHPDAKPDDIEVARKLLMTTAAALVEAHHAFTASGYTVDKLDGLTRKYKL